ncbi:MAG: ATP-binding cassette domain-containing protein [Alphaproteobacteria bacterium]|nr:ATP-binding cassette domain-containing protein [Alphaproteobacteria bacterium]
MLLSLRDVGVQLGGKPVLQAVHLSIAEKASLLVTGPSGSGKTTLLSVIAGFLAPTRGTRETTLTLAETGFVFQTLHLLPYLRVQEQLRLACYATQKTYDAHWADHLLTKLELVEKTGAYAAHLSTGEAQRLAIARALVHKPQLILADEPTAALDDVNCEAVIRLLQETAGATNAALVVVTHDARLKPYFSSSLVLKEGRALA